MDSSIIPYPHCYTTAIKFNLLCINSKVQFRLTAIDTKNKFQALSKEKPKDSLSDIFSKGNVSSRDKTIHLFHVHSIFLPLLGPTET